MHAAAGDEAAAACVAPLLPQHPGGCARSIQGPGRSRARRESSRCCPEARSPRPPLVAPQDCRHRAAAARARLSSPNGALRSRRLQPAGSGSTSSTRPSTTASEIERLCHVCLHMRIHARCSSVFRVALFRRAFALVVAFYLCESPLSFRCFGVPPCRVFPDDSPLVVGRCIYIPLAGAALAYRWCDEPSVMQALKRPQKEKVKQFCVFTGAK